MKKLFEYVKFLLTVLVAVMLLSMWLWLPPLWAQVFYSDWTCAYKKCVVIKEEK